MATNQVKVACPPARLLRKFQVAWMTAAARINANAEMVMEKKSPPRALIAYRSNCVADANYTAGDDLGTQAAAMDQAAQRALAAEFFQVGAGIAEARAAKRHGADGKLPLDEMIQSHAAGDEIAPRLSRSDLDAVVALERFDRLALDQRHLPARAGIIRIRSNSGEIAISFETAAGDGLYLI